MPSSVIQGGFQNNTGASVFQEQSNIALSADLPVDADLSGAYSTAASLTPGVIPAGTMVSDLYFDADPTQTAGTEFVGSITFSTDILGVIVLSATLNATDSILGLVSVSYPETDAGRGLELTNQDSFSISADLRTVTFDTDTLAHVDQMRIVTADDNDNTVPEPGTGALLALASVFWGIFRKKIFRGRYGWPTCAAGFGRRLVRK